MSDVIALLDGTRSAEILWPANFDRLPRWLSNQIRRASHPAEAASKIPYMMLYKSKDAGRNSTTGMVLRYPIDFNHIGRSHLIDGNPGRDDDSVPRRNHA